MTDECIGLLLHHLEVMMKYLNMQEVLTEINCIVVVIGKRIPRMQDFLLFEEDIMLIVRFIDVFCTSTVTY